jgi:SAM-dependent methyltransferase
MSSATGTDANPARYTFDNATPEAGRQVRLLAEILDEHTIDVLTRAGVRPGWRCLDLGAGAGTITGWLAEQVGPTGSVVAVDADPRHIPAADRVEVRTQDIATAAFGDGEFDLIHARLLAMHLPPREDLVHQWAQALKPGGVLVISDWDCTHLDDMLLRSSDDVAEAFMTFQHALIGLGLDNGMDPGWARRIPRIMHEAGLEDVEAELYNRVWTGGEAGCLLHASNSHQLEQALLARGVTVSQLAVLRAAMADWYTLAWSYPMVTAVGRRAGTN